MDPGDLKDFQDTNIITADAFGWKPPDLIADSDSSTQIYTGFDFSWGLGDLEGSEGETRF